MMTIVTSIYWALILCQELCWSQNTKYFLSLLSFPIEENWDSDFKWFFWGIFFLYFVHIKSTDLNSVSLWLQNPHESVSPASKTLTTYEGKETEDAGIWGWASGQHLVHIRYFTWVQVYTGLPWWLSWQRIHLQCRGPQFNSWVGKIPWRRDRLPTLVFLGFPGGSDSKESFCNAGDLGLIPGLGRSSGGGQLPPVFLPGESPWMEEPGRLQPIGSQRNRHDWVTKHTSLHH